MPNVLDTVVSIPVVVFDHDNTIDEHATARVSDRMVRHGISVLTINGNTGEFYSLSPEERRLAVEIGRQFSDRAELVAGIGFDVATAKKDAQFAIDNEYRHLMVHQPPHPFISSEGWLQYHVEIAKSFPDVNIIPYIKNPHITVEAIYRLIDTCPNIGAVKYALEDANKFGQLVSGSPRELGWICGVAEKWAPSFWSVTGISAFTSGLANVSPKVTLDLYRALKSNDTAEVSRLWKLIRSFEDLRSESAAENNVSVVKEALAQLGGISPRVRAPISQVNNATSQSIEIFLNELREAGYIDGED